MDARLDGIFTSMTLYSDDVVYALIKLPARAVTAAAGVLAESGDPFAALIVDKNELTLVLADDELEEFAKRLPGYTRAETSYRLITFDIELPPDLTGFMARISTALAEAGVPILPLAAYSRDHILVPAEQYDTTINALEALRNQ
jgi:hypothetical protein